jgi:acetyl-CoA carboxylase beta subunit
MSRSKCHSCRREFFAHELTEEDSFCAQCQALLQETFDDIREATRRPATHSGMSEGHGTTQS